IADYERRAAEIVPKVLYEPMFARGESTIRNNTTAFEKLKFQPRVLVDVSSRNLATSVLGQRGSMPGMLAPVGGQMRVHAEGDLASVRAAGAAGTLMTLNHSSNYSIEEVAREASGPIWFQLYFLRDREILKRTVQRAEDAGYQALVVTVDTPGFQT